MPDKSESTMPDGRLTILFDKQLRGQISAEERVELLGLFLEPVLQPQLQQLVEQAWDKTGREDDYATDKVNLVFRQLLDKGNAAEETPVINMEPADRRRVGRRWMIAASVIVLLALGSYFAFFSNSVDKPGTPVAAKPSDVEAPKVTKAMITLADGRTVSIDSINSGMLAQQSDVRITKTADGKIVYSGNANALVYNTLINPRGSKVIDMALADGSHVWLNAGSSIIYPVAFVGGERKVAVTGEAYFEVAHDAGKPFKVSKGETEVTVLGTHFNINAYDDEATIKVTLLEGSVEVKNQKSKIKIKPGQQAVMNRGQLTVYNNVDTEEVMAWKNGKFEFKGADVESVMRQIARWYDVQVVYEGQVPEANFRGGIGRTENVSQVLKMLELTQAVQFKVEDKKVTVTRWKQ